MPGLWAVRVGVSPACPGVCPFAAAAHAPLVALLCSLTNQKEPRRASAAAAEGSSGEAAASEAGGVGSGGSGSSASGGGAAGGNGASLMTNAPESRYREVGRRADWGHNAAAPTSTRMSNIPPTRRQVATPPLLLLLPQPRRAPRHAAVPPLPLQVLAVPLAVRPLFPGGIMPVTVTNNQLIKELVELRRQG